MGFGGGAWSLGLGSRIGFRLEVGGLVSAFIVLLSHHSGLASWDWIERVLFSVCIWLGNQTDSSLACLSLRACLVSPGGDANWSVC
jgi:hypothetical protein